MQGVARSQRKMKTPPNTQALLATTRMTDKIRVTSANGGGQWWKSITWAAKAFENSGFAVATTRSGGWNDPLYRVSSGEADVAVSLTVGAAMAAKAVGPYQDGKASHIRALARLVRPDQQYFNMVRADLGIRSFAELARRNPCCMRPSN